MLRFYRFNPCREICRGFLFLAKVKTPCRLPPQHHALIQAARRFAMALPDATDTQRSSGNSTKPLADPVINADITHGGAKRVRCFYPSTRCVYGAQRSTLFKLRMLLTTSSHIVATRTCSGTLTTGKRYVSGVMTTRLQQKTADLVECLPPHTNEWHRGG